MRYNPKPLVLRVAKPTRQFLMGVALTGWFVYLGWRFFHWFFQEGGNVKMQQWSR